MYWLGLLASSPRDIAISKVPCSYHFSVHLSPLICSFDRKCVEMRNCTHEVMQKGKAEVSFPTITQKTKCIYEGYTANHCKRRQKKPDQDVLPSSAWAQWKPVTSCNKTTQDSVSGDHGLALLPQTLHILKCFDRLPMKILDRHQLWGCHGDLVSRAVGAQISVSTTLTKAVIQWWVLRLDASGL